MRKDVRASPASNLVICSRYTRIIVSASSLSARISCMHSEAIKITSRVCFCIIMRAKLSKKLHIFQKKYISNDYSISFMQMQLFFASHPLYIKGEGSQHNMKKLITVLLAVALTVAMSSTAFAADPPSTYSSVPTEGTPAKGNVGSAEGHLLSLAALAMDVGLEINLVSWRNSIQEISSGYLQCYGMSMTDNVADKIETDYYLQQWNGSDWVTYSSSLNYRVDSDYIALSIFRYVAHGYYYRLKTVHKAYLGIDYDSKTLYSSYIYVS
jgi:hypothetical protein